MLKSSHPKSHRLAQVLWDIWCVFSVVGIWPRYIEPNYLVGKKRTIFLSNLHPSLEGLKILHLSDLHFSPNISSFFLKQLANKIKTCQADLILYTGDLLTYGKIGEEDTLHEILKHWKAPLGTWAVLGNHDYEHYISAHRLKGPMIVKGQPFPLFLKLLQRFWPKYCEEYQQNFDKLSLHPRIHDIYNQHNINLLRNTCVKIPVGKSAIQVVGLGDLWAKDCQPHQALRQCNKNLCTLVLSHNPESMDLLDPYTIDVMFSGHTHGGQVKLANLRSLFFPYEKHRFIQGLYQQANHYLHVSSGIGSHIPFRWFCPPSIELLTLKRINK